MERVETKIAGRSVDYSFSGPWLAYWAAILRIFTGLWFLHAGLTKYAWFPGGSAFDASGWLGGQFPSYVEGVTLAAHRPDWIQALFEFTLATPWLLELTNVMIPLGETLIGAALVLGLLTRFAAFWGVVLMVFFYYGKAAWEHGYLNGDLHATFLFLTVIVLAAGRVWGLDSYVEDRIAPDSKLRYLLG